MDFARHIKPLTGESDWPMWKRRIRDLLDYHEGALDVIDKRLVKPTPLKEDATKEEEKEYKVACDVYRKANSFAKTMISSTVSDTVYQKIMDKESAFEAWEALKQQFEATSRDQVFKICTDFFAFSWTLGDDVSTHVAKLKSLWNELNCGLKAKNENPLPDLILVCKILHILPSSFENFKSSWMLLTKDEVRTFDELNMQLCVFERNIKQPNNSSLSQEALVIKSKNSNKSNSDSFILRKKEDICNYCRQKGHWVRHCRKWIADGRPARKNHGNNVQSNCAENKMSLVSIHNEVLAAESNSEDWWIDNGATKHVTSRSDWFSSFTKFDTSRIIKAAGEERLTAVGSGTVEVTALVNGKCKEFLLKDVWLVPKISRNLFSPLAAHDRNLNSEFKSTVTCCSFSVKGKTVFKGVREKFGSLYKANFKSVIQKNRACINAAESYDPLQLYHERWGHQDKRHVKVKLEKELGIQVKADDKFCEPCIYGKTHRLPFGSRKKVSKPGELVSADVCGPFDDSFQKKRYLVVFKDSYTKYRYGFVIREKSEVKDVLEQMLTHAEKQGHAIKEFLSDNGGEFDNADVRESLHKRGIMQRLTAPYTPEQNGGSERENRTIIEMARTFKYSNSDVKFPEAIWAELVMTAIYVLNRTGKSSEDKVSPYELWFKKKPRIKHLRIISSACYIHIPSQRRRKMDEKAHKGYLVGYDGDERYRLYIPGRRQVVVSRDVTFQEVLRECVRKIKVPPVNIPSNEEKNISTNQESDWRMDKSISKSDVSDEETVPEIEEKLENTRTLRPRENIKTPKYYDDFVMTMIADEEPQTCEAALNSKDGAAWLKAMDQEMASHKENKTWELVELPVGAKAIPCKWVYRVKINPDGSILKHKARLVAKGYDQRKGIDYTNTFSPVAKLQTIRLMLGIAATEKMHLSQFDVSTAFLYGDVEETIYMKQPEQYNDNSGRVCKLNRSLYGLKQSPRCWNKRIEKFLKSLGFKVSEEEPCMFIREKNGVKVIIALYVDDGLIASICQSELDILIDQLRSEFKIEAKQASYFLGLEIEKQSNGNIKICQKSYAKKILEQFNMVGCNAVSSPMLSSSESADSGKAAGHNFPYRRAVGSLMYLMLGSRPDLAYCVGFLSRSLENPTNDDVARLKRVFRYIAGTIDMGIVYHHNGEKGSFECYSDADFGGCSRTGRSTSGALVIYAKGAISWFSQRQGSVTESTAEAEIVAASEASKEVVWLSRLLSEITRLKETPVIRIDNAAAVRLAENPENHRRTKHVQRKHFFIRELVSEGKIAVEKVSSEQQIADVFTKPLSGPRLSILCTKMGLI